jgi:hypothetical protein
MKKIIQWGISVSYHACTDEIGKVCGTVDGCGFMNLSDCNGDTCTM